MIPETILFPVFLLVALNFAVAIWLLKCRYRAVAEGLNPLYFKANRGAKIPRHMEQAQQHYENLYEMPVLFYALVAMALAAGAVDTTLIILAWGYTLSRFLHSAIHLGSNHILKRRNAFLLSFAFLALMWIWFAAHIFARL